jgi:ABC-type multidrug transport system ATPase subunit
MIPKIQHSESKGQQIESLKTDVVITAEGLGKRFNREWIFKNLTYEFISGNTYAITGGNGAGKSTLLQVLSGFVPPTMGSVSYFPGKILTTVDDIFKNIAVAAPYMDLIDEFTLTEQVKFHFRLKKSRHNFGTQEIISMIYLEHSKDKYIGNFSSGMKQRVKLALAFYTDAEIVLLDEPGTNLDSKAFSWYKTELLKLPKNCLRLIASNNPAEYGEDAILLEIEKYKTGDSPGN